MCRKQLRVLTVRRETLDQGTNEHDDGSPKDGPSAAKPIVDPGNEGQRKDGAKRVGSRNDALQGRLRVAKVFQAVSLENYTHMSA
jgi:hypothetical protein